MQGTGAPPQIVQSQLGDDAILLGGLALLQNGGELGKSNKSGDDIIFASVDKPVRG